MVGVAASLSPTQLRELRDAIDRLEKMSRAIHLHVAGTAYRLVRLDDGEFSALHTRSLAIEESLYVLDGILRWEDLLFAEVYLVLQHLTGPSGHYFDDWKSTFSFPFALDVLKGPREFHYLLEVRNYRCSLEFPIRKLVAAEDPRLQEGRIHSPFREEFSRAEVDAFIAHFCSWLADSWESIQDCPLEPFLHQVPGSHVLFGYCGEECFEKEYGSERACKAARKRYEKAIQRKRTAVQSEPRRKQSRRGPR
jgi:hypothetical protein